MKADTHIFKKFISAVLRPIAAPAKLLMFLSKDSQINSRE
jgi:hypothetical protein